MNHHVVLALGALALSVPALIASCSSSDQDIFGHGGGGSAPSGECRVDGKRCQTACDDEIGCGECAADSDCGSAHPFCVVGQCVDCKTTTDCGTGKSCFPKTHTCGVACTTNASCDGVDNAPLCDPATGACVGCVDSTDCGAGTPICEPTLQACSECAGDADCGAAKPICDLAGQRCVECLVDGQCPSGVVCTAQHCKQLCTVNGDCTDAKAPLCRPDGQCVACLAASDCPVTAPVCDDTGRCTECSRDADCPAVTPVCKGDRCVECDKDQDCAEGFQCKGQKCEEKN